MSSNIEEIKRRLDVVTLAEQVTQLRRSGRALVGCCPFHEEKTGSFYVYPAKQSYKCFGCGAYGSAIDLYGFFHEMPFKDAVRHLEAEFGLERKTPAKLPTLTSEELQELGLLPHKIRDLFQEDEEAYRFVVTCRIQSKIDSFADMQKMTENEAIRLIIDHEIGRLTELREAV